MKRKEIKIEYRNRLPHIAPIGATFFVTFRLGDSLPQTTIRKLKQQLDNEIERLKAEKKKGYKEEIKKQRKIFFINYDHQLDHEPFGACHLKIPEIAKIIEEKLHQLDGDKYELIAYCIMPNHVHVLFDTAVQILDKNGLYLNEVPEDYSQLYKITKWIKGSTAYAANQALRRKGKFWQKDSYDHFVRDEKEFWSIVSYILQNPVKAGLISSWQDYQFVYLAKKYKP